MDKYVSKTIAFITGGLFFLMICLTARQNANAVRLKDLASIKGIRNNQLIGYGLVVGLDGTGDKSGTRFTIQSLASMMEKMGVHVNKNQVKVKNVAAVIATADMTPFASIGSRLDVTVSSVGDAKSLAGGTLLMTPLRGADGKIYAISQGPIAVGGFGAGSGGGTVTKNHLLVARIAKGATVEREVPMQLEGQEELTLSLFNPDFTTATRVAETINQRMGVPVAKIVDSATLQLHVPDDLLDNVATFISMIEPLDVVPDTVAKVVVNEKTGTVVIGENVKISTVAISHGNLTITISTKDKVSQPNPLSTGKTVTTEKKTVNVAEEKSKVILLPETTTIGELVRALNAIGVSPRDLISIFQSIKASGALQAELQII